MRQHKRPKEQRQPVAMAQRADHTQDEAVEKQYVTAEQAK
jgi:hypothetical protein